MKDGFLRTALRHAALLGGVAVALSLASRSVPVTLGVLVGVLVAMGNLWALGSLGAIVVRAASSSGEGKPAPSSVGLAAVGLILKMGVVLAVMWASWRYLGASLLGMAVGFSVVLLSVVVDGLRWGPGPKAASGVEKDA